MLSLTLTKIQTAHVKKLTPEEIKDRREKGLCFKCDGNLCEAISVLSCFGWKYAMTMNNL